VGASAEGNGPGRAGWSRQARADEQGRFTLTGLSRDGPFVVQAFGHRRSTHPPFGQVDDVRSGPRRRAPAASGDHGGPRAGPAAGRVARARGHVTVGEAPWHVDVRDDGTFEVKAAAGTSLRLQYGRPGATPFHGEPEAAVPFAASPWVVATVPADDVVLHVAPAVTLTGRVAGDWEPGLGVSWTTANDERFADVRNDGRFTVFGLRDEVGTLYARAGASGRCGVLRGVRPSPDGLVVTLVPGERIRGRVDLPADVFRARVTLRADGFDLWAAVRPDGTFECGALRPGEYTLRAESEGRIAATTVRATAGAVDVRVPFDPQR
jgi:hypothetical protein